MKSSRKFVALVLASAMVLTPVAAVAAAARIQPPPPTSTGIKTPGWAYYTAFAGGCAMIWLMLASTKKGGPTPLEAQMIVANCFLPFIGGYLVEQAHKKNNNIR
jgi:hypothetical protein